MDIFFYQKTKSLQGRKIQICLIICEKSGKKCIKVQNIWSLNGQLKKFLSTIIMQKIILLSSRSLDRV